MNKKRVAATLVGIIIVFVMISVIGSDYELFNPEISRDIVLTRTTIVDRESIFEIMASPEQYPKVLTQNVLEVNIINQTENVIFEEETITQSGVKAKLLVKHEIFPPEKQVIEILDGFAKGTKMIITFSETDSKTTIFSDVNLKMSGPGVALVALMQQRNFESAYNTVIRAFEDYAKLPNNSLIILKTLGSKI